MLQVRSAFVESILLRMMSRLNLKTDILLTVPKLHTCKISQGDPQGKLFDLTLPGIRRQLFLYSQLVQAPRSRLRTGLLVHSQYPDHTRMRTLQEGLRKWMPTEQYKDKSSHKDRKLMTNSSIKIIPSHKPSCFTCKLYYDFINGTECALRHSKSNPYYCTRQYHLQIVTQNVT